MQYVFISWHHSYMLTVINIMCFIHHCENPGWAINLKYQICKTSRKYNEYEPLTLTACGTFLYINEVCFRPNVCQQKGLRLMIKLINDYLHRTIDCASFSLYDHHFTSLITMLKARNAQIKFFITYLTNTLRLIGISSRYSSHKISKCDSRHLFYCIRMVHY